MLRGMSSAEEVAMEIRTTAASCPSRPPKSKARSLTATACNPLCGTPGYVHNLST